MKWINLKDKMQKSLTTVNCTKEDTYELINIIDQRTAGTGGSDGASMEAALSGFLVTRALAETTSS